MAPDRFPFDELEPRGSSALLLPSRHSTDDATSGAAGTNGGSGATGADGRGSGYSAAGYSTGGASRSRSGGGGAHGGGAASRRTGSSLYIAPENYTQPGAKGAGRGAYIHGHAGYSVKVDIFSLAIVAWELMAGRRAYGELRMSGQRIARTVASDGLRPPMPVEWPRRLRLLIERMWADEADDRPEASALLAELERFHADAVANPALLAAVRIAPRRARACGGASCCSAGCVVS